MSFINLQLRKFNMKKIEDDSVVVLIGKRNTGKSFLTKDLLYYHQNIPVGTVVSATEMANGFYSTIVPKLFIHEEYSPQLVANVMLRQKKVMKHIKGGNDDIDPRAFLIFDDCLYDKTWTKDKNVRSVFMNGRHYKMMFIITMQYALGIPPNLRTNIDYIFILRENIVKNRRTLYEHYAGMFPTFDMFCSTMDQCTENYECLVIDNTTKSNKIEDQVFWYKADAHEDFRIGADVYWQMHNNNFDDSDEEYSDDEGVDINDYYNNNRRGPSLNVKKI